MKIKRNCLYALICAGFVFLGFGGGYLTGKATKSEKVSEQKNNVPNTEITLQSSPLPTPKTESVTAELPQSTAYLLVSENNRLNLYEINGDEKILVKTISFNQEVLPAEDKQRLAEGILLENKEDGYELIEDFTS